MKKRMTILMLLISLFSSCFCIRPVSADETALDPSEDGIIVETAETEEEDVSAEDEVIIEETAEDPSGETETINETETVDEIETVSEEEVIDEALFELPEGFVLKESDIKGKQAIIDSGFLDRIDELVEGKDYAAGELMFLADDEEYAAMVAQIYHAQIRSFSDGVAVIRLNDDLTVKDVMRVCLDLQAGFPLVEPNYLVYEEPLITEAEQTPSSATSNSLPEAKGWNDWVNEVFTSPDPFIMTPSSKDYQWQHDMIHTYAGWNATLGDSSIKVAVIDCSINRNHEDLADNISSIEIVNGLSTCYGSGHGNHVAGIIAASVNNGKGGAGIAPNVSIIGINVFRSYTEDGREYTYAENADIAAGINRAVSKGAAIINMSLGGYDYNYSVNVAVQDAIDAGVVVVASAGNDGGTIKCYPAAYDRVISVASVTRDGSRAYYSNYGSWVTVSAPGSFIYSTVAKSDSDNYSYEEMSGTSMASPVVTGALSLYMSKAGRMTQKEAVDLLKTSVNKSSSPQMGYGIIDIEKMFSKPADQPVIYVYSRSGSVITDLKNPVLKNSYVKLYNFDAGDNDVIIYTVDGKNPSVKNGEIVNGKIYTPESRILIDSFEKGKTVKISAAVVNSLGVMGKVKSVNIKTPVAKEASVKVKTLVLNSSNTYLNLSNSIKEEFTMTAFMTDTNNQNVYLYDVEHNWSSSNSNVATVDQYGTVRPVSPGKAKITLTLLDGSKKSASCNVTVVRLTDSISIEGQSAMTAGSSATFKAAVEPANASNKKVTWSISTNTAGATVNANGKVTVPKDALEGSYFYLEAAAQDSSEIISVRYIRVVRKATGISLDTSDPRAVRSSNGALKGITLFTVDIDDGYYYLTDNKVALQGKTIGNYTTPLWTSSNTKVATVDQSGVVTAVSAGKTTITCKANDGSNKKASVTVTVAIPVSSLHIDLGDHTSLSEGKSFNLTKTATYGSQYGKPTTKKTEWSIVSVRYYDADDNEYYPYGDTSRYVTLNKNGTLSIKANALNNMSSYAAYGEVEVCARSLDGTGYEDYATIRINRPLKHMYLSFREPFYLYSYSDAVSGYSNYIECDQQITFETKSSNPNVVGVSNAVFIEESGGYYYYLVNFTTSINKKGSATITCKALDGSNKSVSFKVNVR